MAMTSNSSTLTPSFAVVIALLVLLLLHLSPAPTYCSILHHHHKQQPPPDAAAAASRLQGLLYEEKSRLGSTPPSCYNKCNRCHPCMAVQVPTMPSHERLRPTHQNQVKPSDYSEYSSPSMGNNNRYSNYKPLGWKCRCGGHFYNP